MKRVTPLLLAVSILALCPRPTHSDNITGADKSEREAMSGVHRILATIMMQDRDTDPRGLSEEAVKSSVEAKLRSLGIQLMDNDARTAEWTAEGAPQYVVAVDVIPVRGGAFCYNIRAEFRQRVAPIRAVGSNVTASTWSRSVLGYVGSARLQVIRESADTLTTEFANVFLKSNPISPKVQ